MRMARFLFNVASRIDSFPFPFIVTLELDRESQRIKLGTYTM